MRVRAMMIAVLCLGLNACTVEGGAPVPGTPPDLVSPAGPPPVTAGPAGRAGAIDDFIVVRKPGAVSVLRRADGKPLWSVPRRPDDPIVKARLARGSIVAVRRSQTAEVYDLATGQLRFAKENAGALGVSWTALFADSVPCQPDCSLRAYDLATGRELWAGPQALPGKVLVEPGEPPDGKYDPPGEFDGPLRAPESSTVAVRGTDAVMFLDATTGQELSRVPVPEAGLALGSSAGRVLLEWGAPKECKLTVIGRDGATGEVAWQVEAGTRQLSQPSVCVSGWRPEITDGVLVLVDPKEQAKLIDVETGAVVWTANSFGDPVVAVSRRTVIASGPRQLVAFTPDPNNPAWVVRQWAAELSETGKVEGIILDFDRLFYTTEYEGSPRGIGWVRDLATGRRLWYGDGLTPLGVDGDRVIAETASGEIRLDRMVSTG